MRIIIIFFLIDNLELDACLSLFTLCENNYYITLHLGDSIKLTMHAII